MSRQVKYERAVAVKTELGPPGAIEVTRDRLVARLSEVDRLVRRIQDAVSVCVQNPETVAEDPDSANPAAVPVAGYENVARVSVGPLGYDRRGPVVTIDAPWIVVDGAGIP